MATYVGTSLYAHAKGGCYVCVRNEGLVDLDVIIEGEGALVLCKPCIQDAAEAGGLHLNEAAFAELRAEYQAAERRFDPERIQELEAEVAAAQVALEHEQDTVHTLQDALTRVGRKVPAKRPPASK